MKASARSRVVSSFTVIKGTMIDETYQALVHWNPEATRRVNLDQLRRENSIGAKSQTWLRDVAKVLNRRLDPERDCALLVLAKAGCSVHVWKPLLLWHMTRDEFLLRDFLLHFLYPAFREGTLRLSVDDVCAYLPSVARRGGITEHKWTDATTRRVAAGLLKAACDFDLLRGTRTREFASYHLPEQSFIYLLHAMREHTANPERMIQSPDWRMFLMAPQDVERELLRLHQFKKLGFEAAGSLAQLDLPCGSAIEYAKRMVA